MIRRLKIKKRKEKKIIPTGVIYIKTTINNTIMSMCDTLGNALCWASAGKSGFKGPRRKTPYAAQVVARSLVIKAKEFAMQNIVISFKGIGNARESTIRTFGQSGLQLLCIEDRSAAPHNGCRPPKKRRV